MTEGLCSSDFLLLQSLRHFLAKMPPPFTQGRLGFRPAQSGGYVTDAWLAGQQKAHLCAAGNIRAMPETEIPPAMRGDYYSPQTAKTYLKCLHISSAFFKSNFCIYKIR